MQDEKAESENIVAAATELKPKVEAAIVRLEKFQTQRDKSASLENLKTAKTQLEGVIREFSKRGILLKKYRAAFDYALPHIVKRIEQEKAELTKDMPGPCDQFEVTMQPKEGGVSIAELEKIFLDDSSNKFDLQKFLDSVNIKVNFMSAEES